jgi:alkanesulfonate monooxygenase SsuD/methylene tetrahydromethanopterin reductase-like flavin-dependent oxidoreductase (luciferase family)
MIDPTQFMTEILSMWFERDAAARRKAIADHFHPDVRFIDPDGTFVGYEGLEKFSDALQQRFPEGRFQLAGPPDQMADAVRAFWKLGAVTGMDFALLDRDKIKTLYVFVPRPKH